jgi:thiosulfate dehydrogenase
MKRFFGLLFFVLLSLLASLAAARGAQSQSAVTGDAVQGARIYDNWMQALDLSLPSGNHPLWDAQESNPRNGVSTWRCVECHGWDYKGELGAYGPYSSHYTGFPGVQSMVGATEEQVLDWLNGSNNPQHNFLTLTNSTALLDLAAFLRTQQIDMDLLVDPYTGASLGDKREGQWAYRGTCASCHGPDGDTLNLGTTANPIYLADLAVADPWQTIHKIRFGTAVNRNMPASEERGWSLTKVADVLAYVQSLRRGNPELTFVNTASSGPVQPERQAQIEPIIWGAFVIFVMVLAVWIWDAATNRPLTPKPAKK